MTTTVLEATSVSKSFGQVHALSDVSLQIAAGETLGVIGPNGAGKSTLFGVLAGEHRASSGNVVLHGRDITGWNASRAARSGLGRTFQVPRVFTRLTAVQNVEVALVAARHRLGRMTDNLTHDRAMESAAAALLDRVGLASAAGIEAAHLGQGDRKLLELAMALGRGAHVLLLDEPTAGMGRGEARRLVEVVQDLRAAQPELAVLVTAHHMEVILALADRVVLLADGAVRVVGTPQDVAEHPETRRIYLGEDLL
jgi:branched-chain amino acid transport system ATP-binding protein